MYTLKEWTPELDLSLFYEKAKERGFANNTSQEVMIDCFSNERECQAWILYENELPIGSVVAHSFDDVMGENSYRVLSRACTFAEVRPTHGLMTANRLVAGHQSFTDQFLLPTCIKWAKGRSKGKARVYITTNKNEEGSQRLVHSIYLPTLTKLGLASKIKEVYYRNTNQTVWEVHSDKFFDSLEKSDRWVLNA